MSPNCAKSAPLVFDDLGSPFDPRAGGGEAGLINSDPREGFLIENSVPSENTGNEARSSQILGCVALLAFGATVVSACGGGDATLSADA